MKDRLLTLTLALAAFALFYSLMAPNGSAPQEKPTRPVSTEKGPNGYLAMLRWFEAEGLQPLSLRDRFTQLRQLEAMPQAGNLLISTAPHLYPVRDSEVAALRDWISEGNTLLVAAGLSDTPDWSMGSGNEFLAHMQAMTGLTFRQTAAASEVPSQEDQAAQADDMADDVDAQAESEEEQQAKPNAVQGINLVRKLDPPLRFEMVPNGSHPLLADVKSVAAQSEYPTAQWRGSSALIDLVLELAQDPQTGEPMLWLLRYGNGQIIVSAYGSVFTNKMLGQSDNARLLANIVRWSRGPQGRVIIDDAHQGLVAFYDPEAFFGDKRLHVASLWWLVGLWLVFGWGRSGCAPQAVAGAPWTSRASCAPVADSWRAC